MSVCEYPSQPRRDPRDIREILEVRLNPLQAPRVRPSLFEQGWRQRWVEQHFIVWACHPLRIWTLRIPGAAIPLSIQRIPPIARLGNYTILNGRLGMKDPGGDAALYVKNMANKRVTPPGVSSRLRAFPMKSSLRPTRGGIDVGYNFRYGLTRQGG